MKNPILSGYGYKFYVLAWSLISLAHGVMMYTYFTFDWKVAVSDSLAYNLLFAAMAPGFWYVVNFSGNTKDELSLIGMHVGAATLSIFFWNTVASYPLRMFFSADEYYIYFLKSTYLWRMIIGVLYYSIIILIYYLVKYYQDMRSRMEREMELQHLLKDSELRMLKSQINPHFIFNSLNSISALTVSRPPLAQEMVIKLSNFLRYSLGKGSTEMNSLKEEIQNVTLYLEIEKIRFGSKLKFEKDIKTECEQTHVPNLILQPLVENAIKYGLYESMEDVTIRLSCSLSEQFLHISLSNNFDPEAVAPKGAGIGLQNVRKRLQLVYGRSDLLDIRKTASHFEVILKIPKTETHEQNQNADHR